MRKSVEVDVFRSGVGHFDRKFQTEGVVATDHCWCQKTRMNGEIYGYDSNNANIVEGSAKAFI